MDSIRTMIVKNIYIVLDWGAKYAKCISVLEFLRGHFLAGSSSLQLHTVQKTTVKLKTFWTKPKQGMAINVTDYVGHQEKLSYPAGRLALLQMTSPY